MDEIKIKICPSWVKTLVIENKRFQSSFDYQSSEADLEKCRKEVNETEEVRSHSLRKLKEMLSRDKEFRYRKDDDFLIRYIRYKKFDLEKAYKFICNFYATRKKNPYLFSLPSNMEIHFKAGIINFLPYRDEDGCVIFLVKYGNWNVNEISIWDYLQIYHAIADLVTMNPCVQIHGVVGIWDFSGINTSFFAHLSYPSRLRLIMKILQELYPWKIKRIILFRCNKLAHALFCAARYFLKKKIAERISILQSDFSELHEIVNPAVLPKSYGGSLEDSECDIRQFILDNLQYLKYERAHGDVEEL